MKDWPDLAALDLLVGIDDHGGLGAAARKGGIAQPNANRDMTARWGHSPRRRVTELIAFWPSQWDRRTTETSIAKERHDDSCTVIETPARSTARLQGRRHGRINACTVH